MTSLSRQTPLQKKSLRNPVGRVATGALLFFGVASALSGCSATRSLLAMDPPETRPGPIANPFIGYSHSGVAPSRESLVVRSRKGDRSLELELPGSAADWSDLKIPLSPTFQEGLREPASAHPGIPGDGALGEGAYRGRKISAVDREILKTLPRPDAATDAARRDIERDLGLMGARDDVPEPEQSYLGAIDQIKQLYKGGRFEAALLEVDDLLRVYPTDPKLYEMRGTLLDRLGKFDLAVLSWRQALRIDPTNASLKRVVEKKTAIRSLASPSAPAAPATPVVKPAEGGTP
jgi:hypothetical protein